MGKASKTHKRQQSQPGKARAMLDVGQMLRRAEAALASGQTDAACQLLSQARKDHLGEDEQTLIARAFAVQAAERWDRPARAVASLEQALAADPANAGLHRLRGTLLRRTGRLRAALAELDEAHRLAPGDPSIALEALLTHLATGERGRPLGDLGAASTTATWHAGPAMIAAGAGDLAAAERALIADQHTLAKLMRAIILLAKGESHAAMPSLRQCLSDQSLPGLARAYGSYYLGIAHMRRRELEPAAKALDQARELGLPKEQVKDHLTWTYNQLVIDAVLDQDLARAADWLTKLTALGGPVADTARDNVAYALRLLGQEKARAGKYAEAARFWDKALEFAPRDFVLRQNLAVALERAQRPDEAIPHWHEIVQQLAKDAGKVRKGGPRGAAPSDDGALAAHVRAVAHRHLADLYLEEDDVERAIAQMERALDAVPDDVDTRRALAGLLLEDDQPRKAAAQYERVLAVQADSVDDLLAVAGAYRLLGEHGAAIRHLERAFRLHPDSPMVRVGLGTMLALRALEVPAAAAAADDVRRALELLPKGRVLGLVAKGAVQLAQGRRREAIQTFKRCVRQASDKVVATIEVGRAYRRAGERELAAAAWDDAMKRAKRSPERLAALAVEWAHIGDIERCKECFKELLSQDSQRSAMFAADLLLKKPETKSVLRRALVELIPWAPDSDVNMFLAEGLLRAGDIPAARPLMNAIARAVVATDDISGILFVMDLDYKYRMKLLDRKTAIMVSDWLDAHPSI